MTLRRAADWLGSHVPFEENTLLIVLAICIGLIGGLGAVGFRLLIRGFQWLAIQQTGTMILGRLDELPWWALLAIPAIGSGLVGLLVNALAPEAKGHGVPEVMDAVAFRGGRIRPRVVLIKSLASGLNIGTGGSVGREGPIVQIGSAIASTIGQLLGMHAARLRVLVAAGAAAGIAATFNAPFAGVVFAVEIILGSFAITTITPIIIASVVGTLVCHGFPGVTGGDVRAFAIPRLFRLVSAWEIPAYFALGAVAAVVAVAFMSTLHTVEKHAARFRGPAWLLAAGGGVALGGLFLVARSFLGGAHVWGVGYETIERVLRGEMIWQVALCLVAMKIVATSITLGTGGSGGVFAPSLVIGAVLGLAFGHLVHGLAPEVTAGPGAYALVGMGAVVAGTTHAPLTAILILFEMTGDYAIMLPLMIACVLASLTASRLRADSIYTQKLTARGVCLKHGVETTVMETTKVTDIMRPTFPSVRAGDPVDRVEHLIAEEKPTRIYVLDDGGRLQGTIDARKASERVRVEGSGRLTAAALAEPAPSWVSPEDSLVGCIARLDRTDLEELPVLEGPAACDGEAAAGPMVGIISFRDIIMVYNREVVGQASHDLRYVYRDDKTERSDYVEMPSRHRVDAVPATAKLVGRTLRELDLRARYRVNVVAVRSRRVVARVPDSDVPDPDRPLRRADTLIIVGAGDDIDRFRCEI